MFSAGREPVHGGLSFREDLDRKAPVPARSLVEIGRRVFFHGSRHNKGDVTSPVRSEAFIELLGQIEQVEGGGGELSARYVNEGPCNTCFLLKRDTFVSGLYHFICGDIATAYRLNDAGRRITFYITSHRRSDLLCYICSIRLSIDSTGFLMVSLSFEKIGWKDN